MLLPSEQHEAEQAGCDAEPRPQRPVLLDREVQGEHERTRRGNDNCGPEQVDADRLVTRAARQNEPGDRKRGDADGQIHKKYDDIRARVQQLTMRQQRFERSLAKRLAIDAHGLEAMDNLIALGPLTPTELAHRLDISTAAMTLVLNRLEDAGHIRRERHPNDGRKLLVIANDESADQAQNMVLPLVEGVEALIASMSASEREIASRFVDELIRLYDESTPATR